MVEFVNYGPLVQTYRQTYAMSQQFLRFQEQIKTGINQARKESIWSDKAVFFFRRVEVGRVESSRGRSSSGKQSTLGGTRRDKERTDSKVHS